MKPKTEITIPDEILKEIEAYSKAENITLNEFVIWALGEKVGELRGRRGVKDLTRINMNPSIEKPVADKSQQTPANIKRLLKAEEIAKYLRISKSGAYHLLKTGEIPVVRIGTAVRVREEDLEKFVLNSKG
jgi:excisionase family DNA binding protein